MLGEDLQVTWIIQSTSAEDALWRCVAVNNAKAQSMVARMLDRNRNFGRDLVRGSPRLERNSDLKCAA